MTPAGLIVLSERSMRLRNEGAPWRRSSNSQIVVPKGGVFEPTEKEERFMRSRGQIGKRFVVETDTVTRAKPPAAEPIPEPEVEEEEEEEEGDEDEQEEWSLRMSPETYIQLHPEGKWAPLARKVIKAEE